MRTLDTIPNCLCTYGSRWLTGSTLVVVYPVCRANFIVAYLDGHDQVELAPHLRVRQVDSSAYFI